jgi:leucyl aminopeptidase
MNFAFASGDAAKARADVLVFPLFDTDFTDKKEPHAALAKADKATKGLLLKTAQDEGFKGKAEQTFVFVTQGKLPARRVILVGLGSRARFTPEVLRLAAGRAVKAANRLKAKSAVLQLPVARDVESSIRAVVEGFGLGAYRYDRWRTTNKEDQKAPRVEKLSLLLAPSKKASKETLAEEKKARDAALELGRQVAEATNWARDLVNEPAGTMTPTILADEAKKMAKEVGLNIAISDRKKIEELKMGMFLGVARGSVEEPKLVHLSYVPRDPAHAKAKPLCIVGKAITFDSGGLSLKPSDGMLDMKTDMAGSAAMLGALPCARLLGRVREHALGQRLPPG